MDAIPSIDDRSSKRYASQWLWATRLIWLLMAFVSLVIFAQGVPIFVEELRATYGANLGLSLQRNQANELILIPDEGGQAARAGVMERDVLVAVDGKPVSAADVAALDGSLAEGAAGTAVTLQIRTGERPLRDIILTRGDRAGTWLNRFQLPVTAVVAVAVGIELLVTLGFIVVAAFIFWRGGQTPIAWLSSLVLMLVFAGAGSLPVQSLYFAELDWQYGLDIWFSSMLAALVLFLLLFPSGRFVPKWSFILLPLSLIWVAAAWFWPDLYFWRLDSRPYLLILVIILLIGITTQLWRYRFVSSTQQRQQTKWVVWGISAALTALFIQFATGLLMPSSPLLFDLLINPLTRLAQLFIPITFAVAIFQRRLWEIDLIVNRTLVYGGLVALITAVYILLVGGVSALASSQSGSLIGLVIATVVVAFGLRPMLDRWQTAVNRIIPPPATPPAKPGTPESQEVETAVALRGAKLWLAWLSLGIALLILAAFMAITAIWGSVGPFDWFMYLTCLAYLIVGTIIVVRRPANRIGILCLLIGWLTIVALCGLYEGAVLAPFSYLAPLYPYAMRISLTSMQIVCLLMFVYLPLLFPTGHYLNKNWRRFGHGLALVTSITIALTFIQPGTIFDWGEGRASTIINPFAVDWAWLANIPQLTLIYLWGIPTMTAVLVAIIALIARWRSSEGRTKQQTKWVVFFLGAVTLPFITLELMLWVVTKWASGTGLERAFSSVLDTIYSPFAVTAWLGIPIVISVAILKDRLYDIDVIINRTLVYGGLSLGTVAVYVLVVGTLGTLFQSQGNVFFALLATGLIAVLFQPVRERLQRSVDRLMFGERDDPYAVLSKLGTQLQTTVTPHAMLRSVVETIATSLKLPYAAIELVDEQARLDGAKIGKVMGEVMQLPLRYQNETVGFLIVSSRSPGESFTERERRLLADIATQAGAVASSVRLTAALQRSREKLVFAREEERRRIRRDLHDGLGPTLASQTFTMDAILDRLEADPQAAARLVHELKRQNKETVTEIRRLVYELRPPVLDELGLLEALKTHVAQLNRPQNLEISVTSQPDPLPALSAAVEVAAYRIVLETFTNVVRHAEARHCTVHLEISEDSRPHLGIVVSDDGKGLPVALHPGVGLQSIQERAEELGGSLVVQNLEKGTQVSARLPLALPSKSHD